MRRRLRGHRGSRRRRCARPLRRVGPTERGTTISSPVLQSYTRPLRRVGPTERALVLVPERAGCIAQRRLLRTRRIGLARCWRGAAAAPSPTKRVSVRPASRAPLHGSFRNAPARRPHSGSLPSAAKSLRRPHRRCWHSSTLNSPPAPVCCAPGLGWPRPGAGGSRPILCGWISGTSCFKSFF